MNIFKNLFGRKKSKEAKEEINRYFRTGIFNKFVSVLVTVCFIISVMNLPAFAKVEDGFKKDKDKEKYTTSILNDGQEKSVAQAQFESDRDNIRLINGNVIQSRFKKDGKWEYKNIGTYDKDENGELMATRKIGQNFVKDDGLKKMLESKSNKNEFGEINQQNNVLGAYNNEQLNIVVNNEQTNTASNTPASVSEQDNKSVTIGLPSGTNKEEQEKINEPKIDNNVDEPNKVAENKQEEKVISSTVIGEYKPEQKNEQEVSDVVNEQNKKEDNLATPGATNTTNVANTDISNTNKNDNVLNNQTNENQISSVENATNSVAQILNDTQKGLMAPVSVAMDAAISVVSENTNNLNLPTKLMNSAKNIVNGTKSIGNVGTAKLTSKKPITEKKVTKAQAINNSAKTVNDRIKKLSEKKGTIKIDAKSNETVTKGKNTTTRKVTESYTTKSGNKVNVEATHKSTKKAKGVKEFEYNRTKTVKDSKGNLKGKTETSRKLTVSKNGKVTGTETVKVYDKNGKLVKTITRKINGTRKVIKDKKGNKRVVYKLDITGTQKEKKNGKWVETKLKKESRTYINTYRKVGNKIYKTHSRISTIDGKTTRISASETIENGKKTVRRTVEKNGKVTRFTEEGKYNEKTGELTNKDSSSKSSSIDNKIKDKYGKEGLEAINKISKQTGIDKNTIYKELVKAKVSKDKFKKASSILLSQMSKGAKIINCSAEALSNLVKKASKALLAIQQLAVDIASGAFFKNNKKGSNKIQTSMSTQKKILNQYGIKADGYSISLSNLKESLKPGESAIVHVNGNHFITVSKNKDGSFTIKDNKVKNGKAVKYSDAEFTKVMKNKYKVTGKVNVLTSSKSVAKKGTKLSEKKMKAIAGADHYVTETYTVTQTYTVQETRYRDVPVYNNKGQLIGHTKQEYKVSVKKTKKVKKTRKRLVRDNKDKKADLLKQKALELVKRKAEEAKKRAEALAARKKAEEARKKADLAKKNNSKDYAKLEQQAKEAERKRIAAEKALKAAADRTKKAQSEYNKAKKEVEERANKTITTKNKDGSSSVVSYDANGEMKSSVNYDKSGKKTSETTVDILGNATTTEYAKDGKTKTAQYVTNAATGETVTTDYAKDGKTKIKETINDKDGNLKSAVEYRENGTKLNETIIDKNGDMKTTEYAENGKKTKEIINDKNGNLKSEVGYREDGTKANETVADKNGDMKTTEYAQDGTTKIKETINDKDGNLKSDVEYQKDGITKKSETTVDVDGKINTVNYDEQGKKTGSTQSSVDTNGNVTTTEFDATGKKTGSTITSTDEKGNSTTVIFDANDNKLGTSVTAQNEDGTTTTVNFDANNKEISSQTVNAQGKLISETETLGNGDVKTTNYDENGEKTGYSITTETEEGVKITDYDVNDNKLGSADIVANADGTLSITTYDANDNKLEENLTDANGNILDGKGNKVNDNNKQDGFDLMDTLVGIGKDFGVDSETVSNVFKTIGVTEEQLSQVSSLISEQLSKGANIANCAAQATTAMIGAVTNPNEFVVGLAQLAVDVVSGDYTKNNINADGSAKDQIFTTGNAMETVQNMFSVASQWVSTKVNDFVSNLKENESANIHVDGNHFITATKNQDGSFAVKDNNVNNGKTVNYSEEEFKKLMNNQQAKGIDETGKELINKGYKAADENGNVNVLTASKTIAESGTKLTAEQKKNISGAWSFWGAVRSVARAIFRPAPRPVYRPVYRPTYRPSYTPRYGGSSYRRSTSSYARSYSNYRSGGSGNYHSNIIRQQSSPKPAGNPIANAWNSFWKNPVQSLTSAIKPIVKPFVPIVKPFISSLPKLPSLGNLFKPKSNPVGLKSPSKSQNDNDKVKDKVSKDLKGSGATVQNDGSVKLSNGNVIPKNDVLNDKTWNSIVDLDTQRRANANNTDLNITKRNGSYGYEGNNVHKKWVSYDDLKNSDGGLSGFTKDYKSVYGSKLRVGVEKPSKKGSKGTVSFYGDNLKDGKISSKDLHDAINKTKGASMANFVLNYNAIDNDGVAKKDMLTIGIGSDGALSWNGSRIEGGSISWNNNQINKLIWTGSFISMYNSVANSEVPDLTISITDQGISLKSKTIDGGSMPLVVDGGQLYVKDGDKLCPMATFLSYCREAQEAQSNGYDLKVGKSDSGELAFKGDYIVDDIQIISKLTPGALENYGEAYSVATKNKLEIGYDPGSDKFVYKGAHTVETGVKVDASNGGAITAFGNRYETVLDSGTDVKFTEDGHHLTGANIDGEIDITSGVFADGDTNIINLNKFLNNYKQLEGTDLKITQCVGGSADDWNSAFNISGGNIKDSDLKSAHVSWGTVFDGKGENGFLAQYRLIQGGNICITVDVEHRPTGYIDSETGEMLKDSAGNNIKYGTDKDTFNILKGKRIEECRTKLNSIDTTDQEAVDEFFEFCGYDKELIFTACDTDGDGKLTNVEAKKYDDIYINGSEATYGHDDVTHDLHRMANGRRSFINDNFPGEGDEKYDGLTITFNGEFVDSKGNGYMPVIVTSNGDDDGEVGKVEVWSFDASKTATITGKYGDYTVYGYETKITDDNNKEVPIIRIDFTGDHEGEAAGFLKDNDDTSSIYEKGSDGSGGGNGSGNVPNVITAGIIKGNETDGWTISGAGSQFSIIDGKAKIMGNGTRAYAGSEIGVSAEGSDGNKYTTKITVTSNSCYVFTTDNGWRANTTTSSFKFSGTAEENRNFVSAVFYAQSGDTIEKGELDNFNFRGEYKGSFYDVAGIMDQEGITSFKVSGYYGADGKDGPRAVEKTTFNVSIVNRQFQFKCTEDTKFYVPDAYKNELGEETYTIEKGGYATMAYHLAQTGKTITVNGEKLTGSAVWSEYDSEGKPAKGARIVGYMYSLTRGITCTSNVNDPGYLNKETLDSIKGDAKWKAKWKAGSLVNVDFSKNTFKISMGILDANDLTVNANVFNELTAGKKNDKEDQNTGNGKDKFDFNPFFNSSGIKQEGDGGQVKISGTFYFVSSDVTVSGLVAAVYASKSTLQKGDLTPGGASVKKVDEKTGKQTEEYTGTSKFDNKVQISKTGEWEIVDAKFEWGWDLLDGNSENRKKFENYLGFTAGQIGAGIASIMQYNPITMLTDFVYIVVTGDDSIREEREKEITRLAYGVDTTNKDLAAEKTQQAAFVSAVAVLAAAITIGTLGEGAGIAAILVTTAMASMDAYFATIAATGVYNSYQAWQEGTGSLNDVLTNTAILALLFIPGAGEALGVTTKITMAVTKSALTKTATKAVIETLGKEGVTVIDRAVVESAVKTSIESGVEKGVAELTAKGFSEQLSRDALTNSIENALKKQFGEGVSKEVLDVFTKDGFSDGMKSLESVISKETQATMAQEAENGFWNSAKKDLSGTIKNTLGDNLFNRWRANIEESGWLLGIGRTLGQSIKGVPGGILDITKEQFLMGFTVRTVFGNSRNFGMILLHNAIGMVNSGKHFLMFIAVANEVGKDVIKPLNDFFKSHAKDGGITGWLASKLSWGGDMLLLGTGNGERGITDMGIDDIKQAFVDGAIFYFTLPLLSGAARGLWSGTTREVSVMFDSFVGEGASERIAGSRLGRNVVGRNAGKALGRVERVSTRFSEFGERGVSEGVVGDTGASSLIQRNIFAKEGLSIKGRLLNRFKGLSSTGTNIFMLGYFENLKQAGVSFKFAGLEIDAIYIATAAMAILSTLKGAKARPVTSEMSEGINEVKEYAKKIEGMKIGERANDITSIDIIKEVSGIKNVKHTRDGIEIKTNKGEIKEVRTTEELQSILLSIKIKETFKEDLSDFSIDEISNGINEIIGEEGLSANSIEKSILILHADKNIFKQAENLVELRNNGKENTDFYKEMKQTIESKKQKYDNIFGEKSGVLEKIVETTPETKVSVLREAKGVKDGKIVWEKLDNLEDVLRILNLSSIAPEIAEILDVETVIETMKDNYKNYKKEDGNFDTEKFVEYLETEGNYEKDGENMLNDIISLSMVSTELSEYFEPESILETVTSREKLIKDKMFEDAMIAKEYNLYSAGTKTVLSEEQISSIIKNIKETLTEQELSSLEKRATEALMDQYKVDDIDSLKDKIYEENMNEGVDNILRGNKYLDEIILEKYKGNWEEYNNNARNIAGAKTLTKQEFIEQMKETLSSKDIDSLIKEKRNELTPEERKQLEAEVSREYVFKNPELEKQIDTNTEIVKKIASVANKFGNKALYDKAVTKAFDLSGEIDRTIKELQEYTPIDYLLKDALLEELSDEELNDLAKEYKGKTSEVQNEIDVNNEYLKEMAALEVYAKETGGDTLLDLVRNKKEAIIKAKENNQRIIDSRRTVSEIESSEIRIEKDVYDKLTKIDKKTLLGKGNDNLRDITDGLDEIAKKIEEGKEKVIKDGESYKLENDNEKEIREDSIEEFFLKNFEFESQYKFEYGEEAFEDYKKYKDKKLEGEKEEEVKKQISDLNEKLSTDLKNLSKDLNEIIEKYEGKDDKVIESIGVAINLMDMLVKNMEFDDYLLAQKTAILDCIVEMEMSGNITRFLREVQTGGGKTVITACLAIYVAIKEAASPTGTPVMVLTNTEDNAMALEKKIKELLGDEGSSYVKSVVGENAFEKQNGVFADIIVTTQQNYLAAFTADWSTILKSEYGENIKANFEKIGVKIEDNGREIQFENPLHSDIAIKLLKGEKISETDLKDKGLIYDKAAMDALKDIKIDEKVKLSIPLGKRSNYCIADEVDATFELARQSLTSSLGKFKPGEQGSEIFEFIHEKYWDKEVQEIHEYNKANDVSIEISKDESKNFKDEQYQTETKKNTFVEGNLLQNLLKATNDILSPEIKTKTELTKAEKEQKIKDMVDDVYSKGFKDANGDAYSRVQIRRILEGTIRAKETLEMGDGRFVKINGEIKVIHNNAVSENMVLPVGEMQAIELANGCELSKPSEDSFVSDSKSSLNSIPNIIGVTGSMATSKWNQFKEMEFDKKGNTPNLRTARKLYQSNAAIDEIVSDWIPKLNKEGDLPGFLLAVAPDSARVGTIYDAKIEKIIGEKFKQLKENGGIDKLRSMMEEDIDFRNSVDKKLDEMDKINNEIDDKIKEAKKSNNEKEVEQLQEERKQNVINKAKEIISMKAQKIIEVGNECGVKLTDKQAKDIAVIRSLRAETSATEDVPLITREVKAGLYDVVIGDPKIGRGWDVGKMEDAKAVIGERQGFKYEDIVNGEKGISTSCILVDSVRMTETELIQMLGRIDPYLYNRFSGYDKAMVQLNSVETCRDVLKDYDWAKDVKEWSQEVLDEHLSTIQMRNELRQEQGGGLEVNTKVVDFVDAQKGERLIISDLFGEGENSKYNFDKNDNIIKEILGDYKDNNVALTNEQWFAIENYAYLLKLGYQYNNGDDKDKVLAAVSSGNIADIYELAGHENVARQIRKIQNSYEKEKNARRSMSDEQREFSQKITSIFEKFGFDKGVKGNIIGAIDLLKDLPSGIAGFIKNPISNVKLLGSVIISPAWDTYISGNMKDVRDAQKALKNIKTEALNEYIATDEENNGKNIEALKLIATLSVPDDQKNKNFGTVSFADDDEIGQFEKDFVPGSETPDTWDTGVLNKLATLSILSFFIENMPGFNQVIKQKKFDNKEFSKLLAAAKRAKMMLSMDENEELASVFGMKKLTPEQIQKYMEDIEAPKKYLEATGHKKSNLYRKLYDENEFVVETVEDFIDKAQELFSDTDLPKAIVNSIINEKELIDTLMEGNYVYADGSLTEDGKILLSQILFALENDEIGEEVIIKTFNNLDITVSNRMDIVKGFIKLQKEGILESVVGTGISAEELFEIFKVNRKELKDIVEEYKKDGITEDMIGNKNAEVALEFLLAKRRALLEEMVQMSKESNPFKIMLNLIKQKMIQRQINNLEQKEIKELAYQVSAKGIVEGSELEKFINTVDIRTRDYNKLEKEILKTMDVTADGNIVFKTTSANELNDKLIIKDVEKELNNSNNTVEAKVNYVQEKISENTNNKELVSSLNKALKDNISQDVEAVETAKISKEKEIKDVSKTLETEKKTLEKAVNSEVTKDQKYNSLKGELDNVKAKYDEYKSGNLPSYYYEEEQLLEQIRNLEEEMDEIKENTIKQDKELSEKQEQINDMEKQITEFKKTLNVYNEVLTEPTINAIEKDLSQLKGQISLIRGDIAARKELLTRVEMQNSVDEDKINREIKVLESELIKKEAQLIATYDKKIAGYKKQNNTPVVERLNKKIDETLDGITSKGAEKSVFELDKVLEDISEKFKDKQVSKDNTIRNTLLRKIFDSLGDADKLEMLDILKKLKMDVIIENNNTLDSSLDSLLDNLNDIKGMKQATKGAYGVTKPEELNQSLAALFSACESIDDIAKIFGYLDIQDMLNKGSREDIMNRYGQIANNVIAEGADMGYMKLFATARDLLIMMKEGSADKNEIEKAMNNKNLSDISKKLMESKAVNMNYVIKKVIEKKDNGDDFVIDIKKLQEQVNNPKLVVKKIDLKDLAAMFNDAGAGKNKNLKNALMDLSNIHAIQAAA